MNQVVSPEKRSVKGTTTVIANTPDAAGITNTIVQLGKLHVNTTEDVLVITVDKVRICLMNYLKRLGKRQGWIAPLGLFVSIILTHCTATFDKKLLGIGEATWQATFNIGGVLSFLWLAIAVCEARNQSVTVDDVIEEMKKSADKGKI